ncbi:transglycosylase domain-containing protein [Tenuibacillus multivorans]|uniref:Penicillin-binding protein 2A n=1 Tax=Tenuibacillus multivorans TaxID=237069 RepID=A0A1H0A4B7_9BACI|nr:PBP1A family penicillin-binding protein [Tenuibacillus multivorans]GEL78378.1 penicillin-binding protein 1F [Tenuibacillus multivorans]SDN28094.1 penicillin-binding protein 2A [Tenuibacillus multivorans]
MKILKSFNDKYPRLKWFVYGIVAFIVLSLLGYMFILLGGRFVVDEKNFVFSESTVLISEEGEEIIKLYDENRTYVPIDEIPDHVKNSFIAIEDHRFYEHAGVDFWSVGRALYRDLINWNKSEGASTITQQLVKNVELTNEKSWMRKTKEVMGAIYLERMKSKDEILEYYLNEIYFGHGIYGVESAAQFFFSKSVEELSLSEGAMLAAMPKAPNRYSPLRNKDLALDRRNLVLNRMYDLDMIDAKTLKQETGKTIGLNQGETQERPWLNSYIDLVINEIEENYHLSRHEIYTGGYEITVGLDPVAQKTIYQELQKEPYFKGSKENIESAVVLLDQQNGVVRAALGGRHYNRGDLNRVHVKRQPGSTIKPLVVYGPALEESYYHPYTVLKDELTDYNGYQPRNHNDLYEGQITLYDALRKSKNTTAVSVLNDIGVDQGKSYLQKIGYDIPDQGLSVALGGLEEGLSPMQMAAAFRTFYDEGFYVKPYTVIEISDRNGNVLEYERPESQRLFSKQTSWYLTRMLETVVTSGTASRASYNKAFAGKTGSTQHPYQEGAYKDSWFVGFNPTYAIATWIGYDQSDENHYLTQGSPLATDLASGIMTQLDQTHDFPVSFEKPDDVKDLEKPVRLPNIKDLNAKFSYGLFDGLYIDITWTPSQDERVIYHVYKEVNGDREYVGQTTGKGRYIDHAVDYLDNPTYYVIPMNPINEQQGQPSNKDRAF